MIWSFKMECFVWLNKFVLVDKDSSQVTARQFSLNGENRNSIHCSKETHTIHDTLGVVLACRCVMDFSSGMKTPHMLVAAPVQPTSTHITHEILTSTSKSAVNFRRCGLQIEIPIDDCPTNYTCHLLDGPTFAWSIGLHVHIVYGPGLDHISVDLRTLEPNLGLKEVRKMWCEMHYEGEMRSPSILLCIQPLLQCSVPTREFGNREWLCAKFVLRKEACAVRVPDFIPGSYGYIVTCVTSHSVYCFDQFSGALLERVLYLVGTELHQVIVFEDGARKHFLSLDFIPHQLVTMTNAMGNLVVAVRSASGETCAYEFLGDEHIRKGSWDKVEMILTGDFVQRGSNQLLLLLKDAGIILTNFTDITATDHPAKVGDKEPDTLEECPKSILNALKGIQLKKHTGAAQLTQYEASQQHKHELLSKSISFMEGLGREAPQNPQRPDPGLLCLIPGEVATYSGDTELGQVKATRTEVFQVVRLWQRLCNDKWVLGILAENISEKAVMDVGVSLVVSGQPLMEASSCRIVWNATQSVQHSELAAKLLKADSTTNQPHKKRRRMMMERLAAALTTSHPSYVPEDHGRGLVSPGDRVCLTVSVSPCPPGRGVILLGTWRENTVGRRRMSEEFAEVKINSDEVCCGKLDIDRKCLGLWKGDLTMSNNEFTSNDSQSLACILAVHSLTQVYVTSKYTNIWRLPSIIKARLPLPEHAMQVFPLSALQATSRPSYSQFGAPRPDNPSSSKDAVWCDVFGCTALHIQLEAEDAVISILHKTGSDVRCILKLLRDCVPADVSLCLLAESQTSQRDALFSALSAIGEEAGEKVREIKKTLKVMEEEENGGNSPFLPFLTNSSLTKLKL